MGIPKAAQPAKLIISIIYRQEALLVQTLDALMEHWGTADMLSEPLLFDFTNYYEGEMGRDLLRRLISFQQLIDPADIAAIKRTTNKMEEVVSTSSWPNRLVNIDPGYLNRSHLILGSTKPAPHRPYLQGGIYADLTLVFQNQTFQPFPWTYPDYQSEKMVAILSVIRQKYLFQLKHESLKQGVVASQE